MELSEAARYYDVLSRCRTTSRRKKTDNLQNLYFERHAVLGSENEKRRLIVIKILKIYRFAPDRALGGLHMNLPNPYG